MAGENPPQEMGAIVLQLLMMRARQAEVVVTATMTAAMTAAMSAAGGRFVDHCDGCDHGHDQCHGDAKTTPRPRCWDRVNVISGARHGTTIGDGVESERPARANTTGRVSITICLHVRVGGVADVDVPMEPRAPHPAGRVSAVVVVAEVTVTVVAVVVVAVVVMTVVMAVMAVMAMTATVAAAGVRVSGGRKRGDRQRDSGDSGSEEGTLHGYFSWVCSRATIALGDAH
jgi:hypothetical protein